ncbi:MAG: class I SAM-dependent methyltransferase [Gammaproteobacteria bacterium]|nr:class I SAM-dependent methyltransferase [Gammaproteobacteria bacterium]
MDEEEESKTFDEYWNEINQKIYSDPKVINELELKYQFYFNKVLDAPSKKLLDVGSGAGICVNTAMRQGFDAMGVEPSLNAAELSKKSYGIKVVNELLRTDDDLPRDYAVLTLWDVIEHVADPEELVMTCAQHLAGKGYLILETPDEGAFIRQVICIMGKYIPFLDMRRYLYYRAHRYYFTVKAMRILLERCGFDNISFYKEHSMYQKGLLKDKLYRGRSNFTDSLYRAALWLLIKVPFFANKMVVVARKSDV